MSGECSNCSKILEFVDFLLSKIPKKKSGIVAKPTSERLSTFQTSCYSRPAAQLYLKTEEK